MSSGSNTIHRKRFDEGRTTPQEYHRLHAFGPDARCAVCGGRPEIRAIVLAPFDEANKRGMLPEGAMFNPGVMQTMVTIKEGGVPKPYLRLSIAYSCKLHQREFERTCAKAPSWCIVEINRGPDPTNRVQVGAG